MKHVYAENVARPDCLECGKAITYGRADKKFCCNSCKDRYNNRNRYVQRRCRISAHHSLARNYDILMRLTEQHINSIGLAEAMALGFNPNFVTTRVRVKSHQEYSCYDITYRISETRIFNIHKMSLTLR